tara:strand:- start:434 stop:550 length:117 start_codon:yes stop_codon:yes gene_type:complete
LAEEVAAALKEGKEEFEGVTSEEVIVYDNENPIDRLFR